MTRQSTESAVPDLSEIPRGEYAYPGPLRDARVGAILTGSKTSTTCLVTEFDVGKDPRNEAGTLEAFVDSSGEIVCVTRTADVQILRLGDVPSSTPSRKARVARPSQNGAPDTNSSGTPPNSSPTWTN